MGSDPLAAAGRTYFPLRCHQAAVEQIEYVAREALGAALVVGPSGCGRTTVLEQAVAALPSSRFKVIRASGVGLRRSHLAERLSSGVAGGG